MTPKQRSLASHTPSFSALALLLLWAVSFWSQATAQTAASPGVTVAITNGAGFISALANDSITSAMVLNSFGVTDSDFDAYPNAIERSTNLTIYGNATAQTDWPAVGLGFVRGKVKLVGPAALIFERVVLRDFRATPLSQSPGFDLVATSDQNAGALVLLKDSILMLRICVSRSIQGEIMSSIPRPPPLPGTQMAVSNVSQLGCLNDTDAPPVSQCWPDLGLYEDIAVAGFNVDAFGRASATRYILYLLNVLYLCERQMTDDCVASLGPLGCYRDMFPIVAPPPRPIARPPPTAMPPPAPVPTGGGKVAGPAIVVGGVGRGVKVAITNGAGFISALANDIITSAMVLNSFSVTDSDFDAYPNAIERRTNLTIYSNAAAQIEWPAVGLGFVRGKVKLLGPAALIFERVVVRDFRATPLSQSPGFDLVATSDRNVGALVLLKDSILMLRICMPRSIYGEVMSSIPRPPSLPGFQMAVSNVSQLGCLNDTDAPPVSQCWPDLGLYEDIAVAGFNVDAKWRASATRYNLYLLNVLYLCERQMTDNCVASLGSLGCYLDMFPRTPIATPPPGGRKVAWPGIVAGCVGGTLLLAAVTSVSFIVLRRKQAAKAEEQEMQQNEAEAKRMIKSTLDNQLEAANGQPPGSPGGTAGAGGTTASAAPIKGVSSNGFTPCPAAHN